jgi:hypothetical protein
MSLSLKLFDEVCADLVRRGEISLLSEYVSVHFDLVKHLVRDMTLDKPDAGVGFEVFTKPAPGTGVSRSADRRRRRRAAKALEAKSAVSVVVSDEKRDRDREYDEIRKKKLQLEMERTEALIKDRAERLALEKVRTEAYVTSRVPATYSMALQNKRTDLVGAKLECERKRSQHYVAQPAVSPRASIVSSWKQGGVSTTVRSDVSREQAASVLSKLSDGSAGLAPSDSASQATASSAKSSKSSSVRSRVRAVPLSQMGHRERMEYFNKNYPENAEAAYQGWCLDNGIDYIQLY